MKKYLFTLFIAFFALSSSFSGGRSDKIFRLVETGTAAEIKKETRYNSDSIYYDRHYRDLPAVGVSINKLVWDFGKTTAYMKMEEFC